MDEAISYPQELKDQLPKQTERPDRIYGLLKAKRLNRLLESPDKRTGGNIEDMLKCTPFRADGKPLVFPFLILEAKSEKGASSFTDIEVQSAFAIRELLILQDELRQAAGDGMDWDGGPLVWFISYKGEQWRVHAATTEHSGEGVKYRVFQVWNGSVNSLDNALQLLLIMDYIADWARDRYREAVIQSLRKLAANDSRSLAGDTDIISRMGLTNEWTTGNLEDDISSYPEASAGSTDPLRAFDSTCGVIRDVRFIRSRHIGLYITRDNFKVFMDSVPEQESRNLASELLDALDGAWRVKQEALDCLEYTWTGKDREGQDMYHTDETFLVVVTIAAYVTPYNDWEQTRELSYLALSESLLDPILGYAKQDREGWDPPTFPSVETHLFNSPFRLYLRHQARDNFKACMSRACVVSNVRHANGGVKGPSEIWCAATVNTAQASAERLNVDVVLQPSSAPNARELVHSFYRKHTVGRNPPTSPIFRLSAVLDELGPAYSVGKRPETLQEPLWPFKRGERRLNYKTVVFAQGDGGLCVFVMDPSVVQNGSQFGERLLGLEHRQHIRTKAFDIALRRGRKCNTGICEVLDQDLDPGEISTIRRFVADLRGEPPDRRSRASSATTDIPRQPKGVFDLGWKWDILTAGQVKPHDFDDFPFSEGAPHRPRPNSLAWRAAPQHLLETKPEVAQKGKEIAVITDVPHISETVDLPAAGSHKSVPLVIIDDDTAQTGVEGPQFPQIHKAEAYDRLGQPTSAQVGERDVASHSTIPHGPPAPAQHGIPPQSASQDTAPFGRTGHNVTRPPKKRSLPWEEDIPEAEASSSAERRKRQRPQICRLEKFEDDILDDDALEELIKDGMFS